jgi:hypothetical protein
VSSDRGLCGGVHSGLSKAIKLYLNSLPQVTWVAPLSCTFVPKFQLFLTFLLQGVKAKVVPIGDKARSIISVSIYSCVILTCKRDTPLHLPMFMTVYSAHADLLLLMQRSHASYVLFSANEVGRKPPIFAEASFVAQVGFEISTTSRLCAQPFAFHAFLPQNILTSGFDFSLGHIYFNQFK